MNCLVTGGAGFIGSHVVDELVLMGHDVVVLDDLSGGFKDNLLGVQNKIRFIEGSVMGYGGLEMLFEAFKFDYVFHLAAYAAEGLSHFIRRFNYNNNLIGSVNLINLAVKYKVKRFVFTSSIAVYGREAWLDEEQIPQPIDPYGISKLAVELDLKAAHEMFGIPYTIFRPHNVYGERQNIGDPYRNVVGIFINQIMQGKPLTIFGDGTQGRAFTYINDVAPAIARSIHIRDACNQIFNIGSNQAFTVLELAKSVQQAMDRGNPELPTTPRIEFLPARNEAHVANSNHSKFQKVFGAVQGTSLAAGLRAMCLWAKGVGPRMGKPFSNIEITEKLPESWRYL